MTERRAAYTTTSADDVVKLRHADAPAVLVTPRRATLGGQVRMQPHDNPDVRLCAECGASLHGMKLTVRYCTEACRKTRNARVHGYTFPPLVANCTQCGTAYEQKRASHRYCSLDCQRQAYRGDGFVSLPAGTKGALSEIRACADLMARGFHVFRAMSPSCPCDLVVWIPNGSVIRVEVKTATLNQVTGKLTCPKPVRNVFDVICYVTQDEIIYSPSVDEW